MRLQLGVAGWYTWGWTGLPDRFRPNINSLPISTFQRVCLRPKLEGCLSLSGTLQAWNAGGLVITGQNIHDLWTFKGALWLLPGVGCVMHIQTHKHTVSAPGFAPVCVYLKCVCNLCSSCIVCVCECVYMSCLYICVIWVCMYLCVCVCACVCVCVRVSAEWQKGPSLSIWHLSRVPGG